MILTLKVISDNNQLPSHTLDCKFDQAGGTLGRKSSNDWVLPDTERHLSGNHATIEYRHGAYYLTDTSTNGVFVNAASSPLGEGQSIELEEGMRLGMGRYIVQVSLIDDSKVAERANPFESSSPLDDLEEQTSTAKTTPSNAAHQLPSWDNDSVLPSGNHRPAATYSDKDPFADIEGIGMKSVLERNDQQPANIDNHYQPPVPRSAAKPVEEETGTDADSGQFPDDDLIEFQDHGEADSRKAMEHLYFGQEKLPENLFVDPDSVKSIGRPAEGLEGTQKEDPFEDFFKGMQTSENDEAVEAPKPRSTDIDTANIKSDESSVAEDDATSIKPISPVISEATDKATLKQTTSDDPVTPDFSQQQNGAIRESQPSGDISEEASSAAHEAVSDLNAIQAFLSGAGLDPQLAGRMSADQQFQRLGALFRLSIEGAMDVLRSRTELKKGVNADVTTIQPIRNNPIKFAITTEDALERLLVPQSQAYLGPEQAVQEAFDDIKSHQIAVMAGLQSALSQVFKRFEPKALEARFEKESRFAANVPIYGSAKLWDKFEELYNRIEEEAEEDFERLLGREFSRAYDEQVARLRQQRNEQ